MLGGVDLVALAGLEVTHAHDERPGAELHLRAVVIEIEEREAGIAAEPNAGSAEVELGARALIAPQAIAAGERAVEVCRRPLLHPGGQQRHRAFRIGEPRGAPRGIRVIRVCNAEDGAQHEETP